MIGGILAVSIAILAGSFLLGGIEVKGPLTAVIAAVVIALVNATLGTILSTLGAPANWITLGLFSFIISAVCIMVAGLFLSGFKVRGFKPALYLAVIIAITKMILENYFGIS